MIYKHTAHKNNVLNFVFENGILTLYKNQNINKRGNQLNKKSLETIINKYYYKQHNNEQIIHKFIFLIFFDNKLTTHC